MRNKRIATSHLFSTLSVVIVFALWQVYAISVNNPTLMPHPVAVLERFSHLLIEWETYHIIFTSLFRLITSLALATVFGTALGLSSGINYKIEAALKPIVTSLRTLPVLSIIVVVLILFGNTFTLYIISFLLLFPIIYQAELDGVKNIDPLLIDVLRLETDDWGIDTIKLVFFPLSRPFLRTALIDAVGLGIKVLVVAEYIAQTKVSIGREIYIHKVNLEYTDVFAWTLVLLMIVLIIEHLVERVLKTRR